MDANDSNAGAAAIGSQFGSSLDGILAQARDMLLNWSRDSLQADSERERSKADAIFALAKEADDLRRRVAELQNEETAGAEGALDQSEAPAPTGGAMRSAHGSTRRRKKDYPKYLRRGDALVKVGLSKDKKTEYKHVVPNSEFRRVVALVSSAGKGGKEFTAEDFLKGFEGASYHAYVVLALLRQAKALVQVRRGTYRIGVKALDAAAEISWKGLPEESHE